MDLGIEVAEPKFWQVFSVIVQAFSKKELHCLCGMIGGLYSLEKDGGLGLQGLDEELLQKGGLVRKPVEDGLLGDLKLVGHTLKSQATHASTHHLFPGDIQDLVSRRFARAGHLLSLHTFGEAFHETSDLPLVRGCLPLAGSSLPTVSVYPITQEHVIMEALKVFAFSPGFGLPSTGPFALKLLCWLKMAGIAHQVRYEDDTRKGPKGKNPWVEINGEAMGDTELIIRRLQREHQVDLDSFLTREQGAVGLAVTRMVEEHLHQAVEWELFVHEEGWREMSAHIDRIAPAVVRAVIKRMLRRHFRKQLHARGLARHRPEDIAAMAIQDLKALAELIGAGPYLFGERPCTADAAVFGQLAILASVAAEAPAMKFVREESRLVEYCDRILKTYFGDQISSEEAKARGRQEDRLGHESRV